MNMEKFVMEVERILKYQLKEKKLLEEALTHRSADSSMSYERLKFVGDAALSIAFTNHFFLEYPHLNPGKLSLVRSANVSSEKLARAAVRSGLHQFIKLNSSSIRRHIVDFVRVVSREDETVVHGGAIKAPKVLADIVESVTAAVYLDSRMDVNAMWQVMRPVFEPIVKPKFLEENPQPVTALYELCQKQGNNLHIKHNRKDNRSFANVYVNGDWVASGSSKQKDNAKLKVVICALKTLSIRGGDDNGASSGVVATSSISTKRRVNRVEIEEPKRKLKELCDRNQWSKPIYEVVTKEGPQHDKRFSCSVKIKTEEKEFLSVGEIRSKVKDAENSAASGMCFILQNF